MKQEYIISITTSFDGFALIAGGIFAWFVVQIKKIEATTPKE